MIFPYLKWASPEGGEQNYVLTADEVLIGRKSDANIVLSNPYVSRHHAKLIKREQGYSISDPNSTHGTYVNGERIEKRELRAGDRICLGQDQVELLYFTGEAATTTISCLTEFDDLEKSINQLASIMPAEYSDLEKISSILDFQYQWGKTFSAEKTFHHILHSALKISGAERGFILLKQPEGFEYVVGMDGSGRMLSQSDFRTSKTVVSRVATEGEAVFMSEGIAGEFAQQESILAMHLVAVACLPLQWISAQSDTLEVQGILYLDSTKTMHVLSGLDQKILNKLALEAANVFEKLEAIKSSEERKRLEQELAMAQETQKSLLPHSLPQFENFSAPEYANMTFSVDTARSMQLLEGAGFTKGSDGIYADKNGKKLSFNLNVVSGYTDWITDCQLMATELKAVGIKVNVNVIAFDAYYNALQNGTYDMALLWTNPGPTPYYLYDALLRSTNSAPIGQPASSNYERWNDTNTDALLNQYASSTDPTVQKQAIIGLEKIMVEQMPSIPLMDEPYWYQYNTSKFVGWPDQQHPFAAPGTATYPDIEYVVLNLHPAD